MQRQTEKYFNAIYAASVVQSSISGEIVSVDGETYKIADADIIPGSLEKNNKCVNGSSFEFGSVFQGELNVTLKKTFDRYRLMGGNIAFTEHRILHDGTTEDVNIGKFYIASAERSKRLTTIKALDSMGKLDIDIADDITGTPFELLSVIAEKCGVYLAQTEESIAALPNGQQIFAVSADTTETYRDLAAYLGMMTGTFVTINVRDQLELRIYALENRIKIPTGKRTKGSTVIADYATYYKGVRARFIAQENYAPYEYVDDTVTDGLILDLGDIPIVKGLPEIKNAMLQTLFSAIKQIRYVPAEFTLVTSDAALELGDRIEIEGEDADTYITSYSWIYHGSEKIKGVGDNPRLKAHKDKTSRQMASLEAKISAKDMIVHTYTNISNYTIKAAEKEIISINYAATANTRPIFIATIPLTMELDGYIVFNYYLDQVLMPDDTVREYLEAGEHFATISNNLIIEKDTRHTLSIKAHTEYCESLSRQQTAKITSFERYITTGQYTAQPVDTTPPTAKINKSAIRAALYAQGMAATNEWDGTINITEYITAIELPVMPLANISVAAGLRDTTGPKSAITANFTALDLPILPLVGFTGTLDTAYVVTNCTIDTANMQNCTYDSNYVDTDGAYRLRTQYHISSADEEIDEGRMCILTLPTSAFDTIQSITLTLDAATDTPGPKFLVQAGDTYYSTGGSDNNTWTETDITGLTAANIVVYGSDTAPPEELMLTLSDPQILCWTNGENLPELEADMEAIPTPQIIFSTIDMTHESIKGIESVNATCEGALILAVSFDDQTNWNAWNGNEWITLSENTSGMSREMLEAITVDQWQEIAQDAENLSIRIALVNSEQSVSEIYINFAN